MADDAIIIDVHVSDFSREARFSQIESAVDDDADADTPADVDKDNVLHALAHASEAFAVGHTSGVIVDAYG